MGQIRMALRAYAIDDLSPAAALGRLNRLMRELQPGAMATVLYAHLDPATRDLRFANAGHPPPLLISWPARRGTTSKRARPAPVGVSQNAEFRADVVWFDPGASLLLYTDGLVERRGVPSTTGSRCCSRRREKRPTTSKQCAITSCPRCSTPGRPMTWRCSRFGRSRSSARACRLDGPALPETVAATRRSVGRWLTQNGVGREVAFEVMVAATEAYTERGATRVRSRRRNRVSRGVHRSRGRDDQRQRRRGLEGSAPRPQGCGLMMMRALMDSVEVTSSSRGTEVRMTRELELPHDHG